MDVKSELRARLRKIRAELGQDGERHARFSALAQDHVLQSRAWRESRNIVLYHSFRDELDSSRLLAAAHSQGKGLFLPRCREQEAGGMDLLAWEAGQPLLRSTRGIAEPPPQAEAIGDRLAGALIVVPGLGFDLCGRRLGYGGGYYDRLLAGPRGPALGLAFSAQIVDKVPAEEWDIPVDGLATEEGIVWF